jgi:hypothetical protein
MTDETNDAGLSRRQALTRLGVGAAAVWTVPIVTGITMPAMAEGSVVTSGCTDCTTVDCTGQTLCGDPATQLCGCSSFGSGCNCYNGAVSCSALQTCPDGRCPDGYSCYTLTCCDDPVCLLPCGQAYPTAVAAVTGGKRPINR